ncbi:MAG: penicillin-binding protein 2, partial [Thermodesulfovibrionales bacterium]
MLTGEEKNKRALTALGYCVIGVFAIFTLRLWQLQVLDGKRYFEMSEDNHLKVLSVAAPRGIIYDRNGKALVKNEAFYSVALIPGSFSGIDFKALSALLGIDETDIKERVARRVAPFETIKLKEGIPFEEVAYIEARRSDFPGLIIAPEITRHYVYGAVASHVVGYLGMRGPEKLESFRDSDIPDDAFIGKWGIEALHDDTLRGTPGKRFIEVDALGRQLRIVREDSPQKGEDLTISLDIELQRVMEEAYQGRSGASVALNPRSGEILALVSLPSFDPNLFARGISAKDWKTLNENPKHPFLNRALQSQYPPGSVFKIVVAAAALEEHILPPDFRVNCTGKIRSGNWEFRCWKRQGHGLVDIHRAIVESCDVFFYEVGRLLGIDRIAKYAKRLGLGQDTGIVLTDERPGFIPTTKWKETVRKQPWYLGETYHSSIGQGYVLTTPIQLAELISAFANEGNTYIPKFTLGDEDSIPLHSADLSSQTLRTIDEGLRGVVNQPGGTALSSRSTQYLIAG